MIKVTRLKGQEFLLNSEMIESIEVTPDTVITLTNGNKLVVRESPEQLLNAIKKYKQEIFSSFPNVLVREGD